MIRNTERNHRYGNRWRLQADIGKQKVVVDTKTIPVRPQILNSHATEMVFTCKAESTWDMLFTSVHFISY